MGLLIAVVTVIISLIVLIIAGDKFVDSSVNIAKKFKMPQAVIGATLVSLGTTLPEILVTLFSIKENVGGIAIGNALGSIIFNSALIGGILLCFSKGLIKEKSLSPIILIISLSLIGIMSINGSIGFFESIILLIIFIGFIFYNYFEIKKDSANKSSLPDCVKVNLKKEIFIFLFSTIAIGCGAYFMVEGAKSVGYILNINDTIIGLIVVAIGTSLPEFVTTINSIKKKQIGIGFGNIIGSNIINGTLLIGLTGVFSSGHITKETLLISIPLALVSAIFLCVGLRIKSKKIIGIILLLLYFIYYLYLILSGIVINFN